MITSIAILNVQNDNKEKFIELTIDLIKKMNAVEGCISFSSYENFEEGNIVTFVENWEDEKSIELLKNSEYFRKTANALSKLCIRKPILMNRYRGIFSI